MEEAIAAVSSPSTHGAIKLTEGKSGRFSSAGTFIAGDESISKTFDSLVACVAWVGKMQAALKSGTAPEGTEHDAKEDPRHTGS